METVGCSATGYKTLPCGCVPGFSRCREAEILWSSANNVYYSQGYDAWIKSLEPYNAHMEQGND